MKVYVIKPTADWDDPNASDYLAKTVLETEQQPRDSGPLDAGGNKLFSLEQREPVGFVLFKEI
jgi:hypothetical protein